MDTKPTKTKLFFFLSDVYKVVIIDKIHNLTAESLHCMLNSLYMQTPIAVGVMEVFV